MRMSDLYGFLGELTQELLRRNKTPADVSYVEHAGGWCTWDELVASDVRYHTVPYEYATDPKFRVVGRTGWWISRLSLHTSCCFWSDWFFHDPPVKPEEHALLTVEDVMECL